MCIVCNMSSDNEHHAHNFLSQYEVARWHIQQATNDMLMCSKEAQNKEDQKRYDRIHKKMVRIQREWNKIEHQREHAQ